jgi:hypothetical protein
MSIFAKSKAKIMIKEKKSQGDFFDSLWSYGLILLGSIFFASMVADIFEFSWYKGLFISFFVGVIMKMIEDLKDENRLLEIASKEHLSDIDALEDRIGSLEKFIKNEITTKWPATWSPAIHLLSKSFTPLLSSCRL